MRNQPKNQENNKNENLKSLETQTVEPSKIADKEFFKFLLGFPVYDNTTLEYCHNCCKGFETKNVVTECPYCGTVALSCERCLNKNTDNCCVGCKLGNHFRSIKPEIPLIYKNYTLWFSPSNDENSKPEGLPFWVGDLEGYEIESFETEIEARKWIAEQEKPKILYLIFFMNGTFIASAQKPLKEYCEENSKCFELPKSQIVDFLSRENRFENLKQIW